MRLIAIVIICTAFMLSCKTTTIYMVRHAEKATQPADNPHLTEDGKTRAIALREYLKDKNITQIHSTEFHRTRETAQPIADLLSLMIQPYKNDTTAKFLAKVQKHNGNSLVVGHSNTTISMLDDLHVTHTITTIPDNDYDNLFIIKVKNGKAKSVVESTYGAASPVGAGGGVMR